MGQLIEFYRPAPKSKPVQETKETDEQAKLVRDTLEMVLKQAPELIDVLILKRNKENEIGLVSTMDSYGDNLFFMKQVEKKILEMAEGDSESTPPTAS